MDAEPTISDVLEAVNTFADKTEMRFDALEGELSGVKTSLAEVKRETAEIASKVVQIDRKLDRTDGKVNALINILERKTVITTDEKSAVLA